MSRRIKMFAALGALAALGAPRPSGPRVPPASEAAVAMAAAAVAEAAFSTARSDVAAVFCSAEAGAERSPTFATSVSRSSLEPARVAAPVPADESLAYYDVDLVTTKKVPGTALARGVARVAFAPSPFGVALTADGSYVYDLRLRLQRMSHPSSGALVAWVTTPQVDQIRRVGAFDENLSVSGPVSWNKYLIVVTLEAEDDPGAATWSGPIVLRGMSRSGAMHTMAGHGPYQQELCATYGYR